MVTITLNRQTILPWLVALAVGTGLLFLFWAYLVVGSGISYSCAEACTEADLAAQNAYETAQSNGEALFGLAALNWVTIALLAWYVIPIKRTAEAAPVPAQPASN